MLQRTGEYRINICGTDHTGHKAVAPELTFQVVPGDPKSLAAHRSDAFLIGAVYDVHQPLPAVQLVA
eukprot:6706187-Prymnesium_polylepis.1